MPSNFKTLPESATPVEAAGLLVDSAGDEYIGGVTRLLHTEYATSEYDTAMQYVYAYKDLQEYKSIRFMLACFTLLLNDDDNF
jgi:hypothetical protein